MAFIDTKGQLKRHNLIRSLQHGFVAGRSTATDMMVYMEAVTRLLDLGFAVDGLYLDFDKVPYERLRSKCSSDRGAVRSAASGLSPGPHCAPAPSS